MTYSRGRHERGRLSGVGGGGGGVGVACVKGKRELLSMCSSLHVVLNLIGVHVILSAVPCGHMN